MARLAGHNRDLHYYVAKLGHKAYFLCIEMGMAKSEKTAQKHFVQLAS